MVKTCIYCNNNFEPTIKKQNICSSCKKIYSEIWYILNKEKHNKSTNSWISNNKEKHNITTKKYYKKHKKKIIEQAKTWSKNNKEKSNENKKKWYHVNIEKARFFKRRQEHNRRCLLKDAGIYTIDEWNEKLKKFNYSCAFCGSDKKIEIDHILPLSKGGSNTIDNLQPLCRSCNAKKYNRIVGEK